MYNSRTDQFTVTKCLIVESGTYFQQYRRPYQTKLNGDIEHIITDRFRQAKGGLATGAIVAGVADHFLEPQAQPEAPIDIAGGWDQVHYRALIEVEMKHHSGATLKAVVMGFSEAVDPSLSGIVPPDMKFRINNIVGLRTIVESTALGNNPVIGVANTSHLISNEGYAGYSSPRRENLTRPVDVFSYISRGVIDGDTPPKDMFDTRTTASKIPVKSERRNTVGASYVGKVLGAYVQSHQNVNMLGGTGFDMMMEAQSTVNENEAAQDWFLSKLKNHRQAQYVDNWFTLRELADLSSHTLRASPGGAHNVLHVVPMSVPMQRKTYYHTNVDNDDGAWSKSTLLVQIATKLSNAIPSLMVEYMFTRAIIKASNRTRRDGAMDVKVADFDSFVDIDMTQNMQLLEARIALEVMSGVTDNNQLDCDIDMVINLDGDSRFMISLHGQRAVEFVCPSFADAVLAPVVTSYETRAFEMAQHFRDLGEIITDAESQAPGLSEAFYQPGNAQKKSF